MALLSSAIQYRSLIAVTQSVQPVIIYEYCMAMYEYIIAASKEDGYSSHLEATTLATGQALHSYFFRSKKYTMKDHFCTYSIDTKASDFQQHKYRVSIQKNNDQQLSYIHVDLPALHLLAFWLYSYYVQHSGSMDNYNIYENLHNLLGSAPIPCTLLPFPTIVLLKYEPIDAFLLHQISIYCNEFVLFFFFFYGCFWRRIGLVILDVSEKKKQDLEMRFLFIFFLIPLILLNNKQFGSFGVLRMTKRKILLVN